MEHHYFIDSQFRLIIWYAAVVSDHLKLSGYYNASSVQSIRACLTSTSLQTFQPLHVKSNIIADWKICCLIALHHFGKLIRACSIVFLAFVLCCSSNSSELQFQVSELVYSLPFILGWGSP